MTVNEQYDVVVVGGGAAGVCAAIQAARAGASTLLIEKTGMLGGTTTTGGVNFPGLFHAWGKQIIAGIGWDLVCETVATCGKTLPDFSHDERPHHTRQVLVNAFAYAALCDEKAMQAGVNVLFHTMLAQVTSRGDGWRLTLCMKTGLVNIDTRVVIDCTGDANATALAGLPVNVQKEHQPATLSCRASGYDVDQLDIDAINAAFDAQVKAGRLDYTDSSWDTQRANVGGWLRKGGANANHSHGINARTSEGKTQLEIAARKKLLRLYRFLRTQPGLENLTIDFVSPECGVRETATIQGQATVTVDDYRSGRVWDDAVCFSFYPIDLHTASKQGLRCEPLDEGVVPTLPRGAMLPVSSRHFIVAGRCISSDRLANSALRVQASCMAMGQAAGAMAALGASTRTDPADLPIDDIRRLLRNHGAIVPGRTRNA